MTNHELAIARYIAVQMYMDEYGGSTYENTDDFKSFAKRAGKTAAAIGGTVAVAAGGGGQSPVGQAAHSLAETGASAIQQRRKVKKASTFKPSTKTTGSTNKPFPAAPRRPISTLMPGWG